MKKLLLAIALLVPLFAYADGVKADKAQAVAENFMNAGTKGGRMLRLISQNSAYYVFNAEGGGFVVVSAEDAVTPILAYSDTGSFPVDNMAPGLADWMEGLRTNIDEVRRSGAKASAAVRETWAAVMESRYNPATAAGANEKVLETALWDQGDPYNRLSPTVDGKRAVTGCVATAISIIMYYYKYPVKGTGTLPDYDYTTSKGKNRHQEGKELGNEYEWDKMLPKYQGVSFSSEQANAVAQLMFDVGVMCQMGFNADGSGASTAFSVSQLPEYMGFDKSLYFVSKGIFTAAEWIERISAEIDEGRPVLYSGYDATGGHAFVCDGYNSEGFLSFNWGWSGSGNGFYALTDMAGFTRGNVGVFNLKPDEGGEANAGIFSYTGISTSQKNITKDKEFKARLENVSVEIASSSSDAPVYVVLGKFSKDDELVEFPSELYALSLPAGYYWPAIDFKVKIQSDIAPGDYLRPLYTLDDYSSSSAVWHLLPWKTGDEEGDEVLSLMNNDSLLYNTSLSYDAGTRTATLTTYAGATFTLTSGGQDFSSAATKTGETLTIDGTKLAAGTYTLTLVYETLSNSIELTF